MFHLATVLRISPKILNGTLRFISPFGAFGLFLVLISLVDLESTVNMTSFFLGPYMFLPFSKASLIPIAIARGINPLIVASSIIALDSLTAVFLALNFRLVYSLPFFGKLIKNFEKIGHKTLERRKWIKGFSTVGLLLFMMIPFQGTGAIATFLIGRLAGVDTYRILLVVFGGSALTTLAFTFFASLVRSYFTG